MRFKDNQHRRGRHACLGMALCTVILAASVPGMSVGNRAWASEYDDLRELRNQSADLKKRIDAAQGEYLAAVQRSEEAEREKRNAEEKLAGIDDEIAKCREKLGHIAVETYKISANGTYLDAIIGSSSLSRAISNVQYLQHLGEERTRSLAEVAALEKEAAELPEKLAVQSAIALEQAGAVSAAEESFKSELKAIRKQMEPYKSAHAKQVGELSGDAQMSEIIEYVEGVEEGTSQQVEIIKAAYRMTHSGGYNNMCEAWAETAIRNAGLSMPSYVGAWQDCQANMCSSDMSDAKAGCLIYGSGSGYMGSLYGHVGIIVYANGNPDDIRVCDSVSPAGTSQTLGEWLSWQTAVNADTGGVGLFGWGYPPGYSW